MEGKILSVDWLDHRQQADKEHEICLHRDEESW